MVKMRDEELTKLLQRANVHFQNITTELWQLGKILDEIRERNG